MFLLHFSLPDSPAEPEPDNQKGSPEEPRVIPHDEVHVLIYSSSYKG